VTAESSVSVVICAYTQRRWEDLTRAVESARAQPETGEVILVIDHEPELLRRARAAWPQITVVANASRQGLSGARNTGVLASGHDIVAFLDDDAWAAGDWLSWLAEPFTDPRVAAVGGRADPIWPAAGPGRMLLSPELLWIVGCSYRGLPTERGEVRNVMGCSMAFRRAVILDLGGFNVDTGRVGRLPLGCEETELCIRVSQADATARILYEPRARVHHRVGAERTGWSYLLSRSYFEGVSKAALSRTLGRGAALAAESSYVRSVLPRAVARELRGLGSGGGARAAAIVFSLAAAGAGYLRGSATRVQLAVGRDDSAVPVTGRAEPTAGTA